MSKSKKGFASLSPEKRRELASKGGKAAHAAGTAHKYTSETARAAGRKGGLAPHKSRGRARALPAQPPVQATETSAAAE